MATKINPRQVGAVRDNNGQVIDLKTKLEALERNIGHFAGEVEQETELPTLNVPAGKQVFVKGIGKYFRKMANGAWDAITGDIIETMPGSGGSVGSYVSTTRFSALAGEQKNIPLKTKNYYFNRHAFVQILNGTPQTSTQTLADFSNGDESDFIYNSTHVVFENGLMKLKNQDTIMMIKDETVPMTDGGLYRVTMNKTLYHTITKLEVN